MIGWLVPAALGAVALIALPIVVHLLRTHRARRIPFPTLRFIAPSRTSAVKLRPPSDLSLLLVRMGIVAAAALAMARPVLVTNARVSAWNARLSRAVVVDTSGGMQVPDGAGTRPADLVRPLAESEIAGAVQAIRIDTASLGDGLVRAAAWLATTPPSQREIVVLSTFTLGAVSEASLAQVPAGVGLRMIQVGRTPDARRLEGVRPLTAPGDAPVSQDTVLTGPKTALTRHPATEAQAGWRIVAADADAPSVRRLSRAVAVAGTPAPSADQPVALVFGDLPPGESVAPPGPEMPRWMLRVLARLRDDDSVQRAARDAAPSTLTAADRWVTLAADRDGAPLARVAVSARELTMQVGAAPASLFAAVAARALLEARAGAVARPDEEILRVPAATVAGWSRPAPPIDREAWRSLDGSDARWLWAIALLLLGVEQWMRRSAAPAAVEVRDAA